MFLTMNYYLNRFITFSHKIYHQTTYLFKSNVDSSWKTCALEKTVRVFFLRFVCIEPFKLGEPLSDGRSGLSGPSSSIISCPSSSDSLELFKYDDEWSGEDFDAGSGGLSDGDGFSVVLVDELSENGINKTN